jgi:preprotein translocase subunit SecF
MKGLRRLFRGENDYDFVRLWRFGLTGSAVVVVLSIVTLLLRGLSLGLDFEGGTAWEVPSSSLSVSETRDALRPLGEADAKIQTVGNDLVRVQSATTDAEQVDEVRDALAEAAGISADSIAVTTVGPSWGEEISAKALRALIAFFVCVALYITFALRDWRMAVGALTAVVHDIIISVGVYSLLQIQVSPATVIAFLTILGFSLYDTVVVYARIRENTPMVSVAGRMTYTEMAGLSLNQVLMRSINTSITSVLPVLSILVVGSLVFGATTLQDFGIALLVGLVIGVYSSVFIATPITAWLNERNPVYRSVRERLAARPQGASNRRGSPAPAVAGGPSVAPGGVDAAGAVEQSGTGRATTPTTRPTKAPAKGAGKALPAGYSANHPPRPRKNKRR